MLSSQSLNTNNNNNNKFLKKNAYLAVGKRSVFTAAWKRSRVDEEKKALATLMFGESMFQAVKTLITASIMSDNYKKPTSSPSSS